MNSAQEKGLSLLVLFFTKNIFAEMESLKFKLECIWLSVGYYDTVLFSAYLLDLF